MPVERTISTETHGRYLVDTRGPGRPLLVGFHGYAEAAEAELARLQSIPGVDRWTILAIQGLHRFYRGRSNDVVAGWMTRQDREFAIADNIAYVSRVIEQVRREWSPPGGVVISGFSQGVAMVFRAACAVDVPVAGVLALGGDIPPELDAAALSRIPEVLMGRGLRDEWYSEDKLASDLARLRNASVVAGVCRFDGGHEWTPEFAAAASAFLASRASSVSL